MVLGAREVDLLHRPPPHTALSTPGAIASLDFSEAISCDGVDEGVVGGSVVLSDGSYQWCCDAMAEDFGFDTPEAADTFDVTSIWSADGPEPVASGDLLYPVFGGLSMGWCWTLWALHTIVVAIIVPSLPLGVGSMVLDKAPPPVPRRGRLVVCVYVDIVSILGVDLPSVLALWRSVCKILEGSGLHLHEYVSPHGALELVGLVFVSKSFWIQHKPARLWKFRRASAALARLRFVFAWQLMCWLGHAVHLAMLFRPILAILLDVYRCSHVAAPTDRIEITKAAQHEIRISADLWLLCTANLGAGMSDEVFCSDATPTGAWRLVVEGGWWRPYAAPVHILEGRASLLGLRRAARPKANFGHSVLSIGDNLSEILAGDRGRSNDWAMRALLLRSLAYQAATGMRWRRRYIETVRNHSDFGSRKVDLGIMQAGDRRVGRQTRYVGTPSFSVPGPPVVISIFDSLGLTGSDPVAVPAARTQNSP